MSTEATRMIIYRGSPILESFVSTMLQDLQLSEMDEREERNSGTIYDCPESTFTAARQLVERFTIECAADIKAAGEIVPGEDGMPYGRRYMTPDRIGSTLYLAAAGHGVGFTDDGHADCLKALETWARGQSVEAYMGEDGAAYIVGRELVA